MREMASTVIVPKLSVAPRTRLARVSAIPSRRERRSSTMRPMVTCACQARASSGKPWVSSARATRDWSSRTSGLPSAMPTQSVRGCSRPGKAPSPRSPMVKGAMPRTASSRAGTISVSCSSV